MSASVKRPDVPAIVRGVLEPLVGLQVHAAGHALDMLWIHFGEEREVVKPGGRRQVMGEWALHVMGAWRLTLPPRIVTSRPDFYIELATGEPDDGEEGGSECRFDRYIQVFNRDVGTNRRRIEALTVDDVGGFSMQFDNDHRLDVFPQATMRDDEDWRLFRPGDDSEHFVFPDRVLPDRVPQDRARPDRGHGDG